MARKVKFTDAKKSWFGRPETERKRDIRPRRRFYLIVCEGTKTEPNYFKGLKQNLPPGVINLVDLTVEGTGHNTLTIIDEVWAVFDRDSFPEEHFNNAIFKGQATGVQCAWTNEALELWYLLHFQFFQNGMSRDDYKRIIERELSDKLGKPFEYEKSSREMFTLLQKYGSVEQAILRAKQLENVFTGQTDYANHNPCTTVYRLIEKLLLSKSKP